MAGDPDDAPPEPAGASDDASPEPPGGSDHAAPKPAAGPRLRARLWRFSRHGLRGLAGVSALTFGAMYVSTDGLLAFGAAPSEATLARMRASPRFASGEWVNAEPTVLMKVSTWETSKHWLWGKEMRSPSCPLPIATDGATRLATKPHSGLRVTWLGHSTTLIEIDGVVVLTDPNWSERSSPSTWVGPRRFHPPPVAIAELPRIDAVVISHEHFDHCDMASVRALAARGGGAGEGGGPVFHVPLGIGAHLAAWGVPPAQIAEHDWWEATKVTVRGGEGQLEIVSTPARHFNGRGVPWRTGALWTSWSLVGTSHRVFFSGDTGQTDAFREIAAKSGPFDVAMLEIGQHHPDWGDIHLGPEGAIEANARLGARHLLPIHWGTFELAYHAWSEPAETTARLAKERGVSLLTPRIGEPVEPTAATTTATTAWWRALPPIAAACP